MNIQVLAINTGCLNHCTYCKTKMARGDLKSYPLEELVEQVGGVNVMISSSLSDDPSVVFFKEKKN